MVPATTAWSKSSKVHTLSGRRSPAPLPRSTKEGKKLNWNMTGRILFFSFQYGSQISRQHDANMKDGNSEAANALVILCRVDVAGNGMNVSVCLCVFSRISSHQISCLSSIIIVTHWEKTWRKEWAAAGRQWCFSAVSLTQGLLSCVM